jgi:hypothetical protein
MNLWIKFVFGVLQFSFQLLQILRAQLAQLGEFIRTCRSGEQLMAMLMSKQYLMTSIHMFSIRDLVDSKHVLQFLVDVIEKYTLHITQQCEV